MKFYSEIIAGIATQTRLSLKNCPELLFICSVIGFFPVIEMVPQNWAGQLWYCFLSRIAARCWLSLMASWIKSVNAKLLGLARSTYYYHYQKQPASDEELVWLRKMDEQYLKTPKSGSRSYATWFLRQGIIIGRKGGSHDEDSGYYQHGMTPKPRTSIPEKAAQDISVSAQRPRLNRI